MSTVQGAQSVGLCEEAVPKCTLGKPPQHLTFLCVTRLLPMHLLCHLGAAQLPTPCLALLGGP